MENSIIPMDFEWDSNKELLNIAKHGVSFTEAKQVFSDVNRIIEHDEMHSNDEARYYCYGLVGKHIMTVRFTIRSNRVRIIGAAYWREGRKKYESKRH